MTPTISPDLYGDLVQVASQPGFRDWQAMVRNTGGCAEPVHLWGESRTIHAGTGELLTQRDSPAGYSSPAATAAKPAARPARKPTGPTPSSSSKPDSSAARPSPTPSPPIPEVFATFTAPSFGPVHHHLAGAGRQDERCHPHGTVCAGNATDPTIPCSANPSTPQPTTMSAPSSGTPSPPGCGPAPSSSSTATPPDCSASHNANGSERRPGLGRPRSPNTKREASSTSTPSSASTAPTPATRSPTGASVEVLAEAIRRAAAAARVEPPDSKVLGEPQPDRVGRPARPSSRHSAGRPRPPLSDGQVAGYLAKYATKGAEASGTADRPLACRACQGTRPPGPRQQVSAVPGLPR